VASSEKRQVASNQMPVTRKDSVLLALATGY
jgi:hypothetical protein